MWHAFSFGYTNSVQGEKAAQARNQESVCPYYLFNESAKIVYFVEEEAWPEFSDEPEDWYLLPKHMKWTYVHTHHDEYYFARHAA